jgi:hypothetical protein
LIRIIHAERFMIAARHTDAICAELLAWWKENGFGRNPKVYAGCEVVERTQTNRLLQRELACPRQASQSRFVSLAIAFSNSLNTPRGH